MDLNDNELRLPEGRRQAMALALDASCPGNALVRELGHSSFTDRLLGELSDPEVHLPLAVELVARPDMVQRILGSWGQAQTGAELVTMLETRPLVRDKLEMQLMRSSIGWNLAASMMSTSDSVDLDLWVRLSSTQSEAVVATAIQSSAGRQAILAIANTAAATCFAQSLATTRGGRRLVHALCDQPAARIIGGVVESMRAGPELVEELAATQAGLVLIDATNTPSGDQSRLGRVLTNRSLGHLMSRRLMARRASGGDDNALPSHNATTVTALVVLALVASIAFYLGVSVLIFVAACGRVELTETESGLGRRWPHAKQY